MKNLITGVAVAAALIFAAPAAAVSPHAAGNAKAYGKYCQDQSKKHVEGQKGTPFSQCVAAMAKAAKSESTTARQACKGMSKKHVEGEKGTPFSKCVSAAAKLKNDQTKEEATS